jgi:outer membrane lipoprotein carrier protein
MNVFCRFALIALLTIGSAQAAGKGDDYARLDAVMKSVQSVQADFRQTVKDAQGRKVEESTGVLAINRPNRFRWDYQEPHPQVIVADGSKLWLYDPDLEQVTVRKLDQSFAGTPAMLLSGEGALQDSFTIQGSEKRNGIEWLTLAPKRGDTDFKRVRIGLKNDTLAGMELSDKLGQVTTLEFSNVQRNPPFKNDRFVFTPPPGVDVIGGDSKQK